MWQYGDDEQKIERIIDKSDILWSISQKYPEEYGLIQPGGEKDGILDAVIRCDNPVLIAVLSDALSFLDRMQQGGLDWHGFSGVRRTPSFEGVIFNTVTLMEIACGNPYSGGGIVVNTGPIPDHLDHDDADAFRITMMSTVLGMDMQIHALRHDAQSDDDVIVLTDTCFDLVRLISTSCDQPDRRLVAETIRKMVAQGLYPRADRDSVEGFYKRYGWGPAFIRDITIHDLVSEVLDMESLYGRMRCVTGGPSVVIQHGSMQSDDVHRYDYGREYDHSPAVQVDEPQVRYDEILRPTPPVDSYDSELYPPIPPVWSMDPVQSETVQAGSVQNEYIADPPISSVNLYGSLQQASTSYGTTFQAFGHYEEDIEMTQQEQYYDEDFQRTSPVAAPLPVRIPRLIPDPLPHESVRFTSPDPQEEFAPVSTARHHRPAAMRSMYGVRGRRHANPSERVVFSLADS